MKKITLEEMRRSVDSGLFIIERCSITAKNMERAGFYIEELRKLHKELNALCDIHARFQESNIMAKMSLSVKRGTRKILEE